MAKIPNIIPVTDLRQDAAAALKRLKTSKQPVIITQRGRAAAVLLSLEEYEYLIAHGERNVELNVALREPESTYRVERGIPGAPDIPVDPVIEAYKKDVDRTLLVENLRKTIPERMASLVSHQRFAVEMRNAMIKRNKTIKRKRSR
jgi:prevent-host-death family protein